MEINASINLGAAGRVEPQKPAGPSRAADKDQASFAGAAHLDQAVANTPDVRPDVVERARALVSETNYPPPETIQKISRLLALNMMDESDPLNGPENSR